ncbi:MAG: F0F1 ATP synthase subunit epsilon [Desulfobacteraceae bacterium]
MTEKFVLEVVTPDKAVVSEEVQSVVAPGTEGEFGPLKGHTPFLTSLKIGALRYKDESGRERYLFINSGFAEVLPTKVTILAESAERRKDIEVERAKKAKERAEKRLSDKSDDIDDFRAEAALRRALHRLEVAGAR